MLIGLCCVLGLFVVCCLLFVVCCLLRICCHCLLLVHVRFVAYWLLVVGKGLLLLFVGCWLWVVVRCLL